MATVNLTDAWLRAAKAPAVRVEIRDGRTPNLAVRITPTGVISFTVRARGPSGEHRVSLGQWPVLALAEARRQALSVLAQIKAGADPTAERAVERGVAEARGMPTVAQRWAEWLAAHERRWSRRYDGEVRRLGDRHVLPALGARALGDVGRADWVGLTTYMRDRPAQAASLYRVTSAFLSYADAAGWIAEHPLPRKGASKIAPTVPARDRVLTNGELMAVWSASAGGSARVRCFVRLMIVTGCRESEAAGICAGEIDFGAGVWKLPGGRTKNGKPHAMPLPDGLLAELAGLVPADGSARVAGFRLLGRRGNALSGFSKIKVALDAKSGVTGWRFHDLRRTVRSGLAALGVPAEIAERCPNHAPTGLIAVYNRHLYLLEVLAALQRWQLHLAGVTGEAAPTADEVVALQSRAVA